MTVATKAQKIGPRKLVALVEQLGELRERVAAIKASERELTELVTDAMVAARIAVVESKTYIVNRGEKRRYALDLSHVRSRLRGTKLWDCLRVDVTSARRHLGIDLVKRLADVQKTPELRVSRRPGKG